MLVVNSMRDVAKVLECITAMAKEGKIVVVRVKDRYIKSPSAGGWRDDLINFYVKSHRGKIEHIGELQVAHSQVRSGGVCAAARVCRCAGARVCGCPCGLACVRECDLIWLETFLSCQHAVHCNVVAPSSLQLAEPARSLNRGSFFA